MIRLILAVFALVLVAAPARPQPADELAGLWAWQARFEPVLHGPLVVTRQGAVWRGEIAGRTATAPMSGDRLRLVFPHGLGEYRGRRVGRMIEGYWLQPAGTTSDPSDPGGSGQAFASRADLAASGASWRGAVRPLTDSFTLYLKIFRGSDGSLLGAFRNPEQGSTGGRAQFLVSRTGDAVRFASPPAPGAAPVVHTALIQRGPERLRLFWPDLKRVIELTRATGALAADFQPRPPGEPIYAYRAPPARGDGWATARAAAVGLDEAVLAKIVRDQIASDPASRRPPLMHSILVARRGKLVLEEYFFGYGPETPHDIRSGGKTYASVMLGAAMRTDPGLSPQSRIYELAAPLGPFAHSDPRKAQITLAQLMTHASGLACNDNDADSPGEEGRTQMQTAQPNWWKATLDLPVVHDPGARYAYCSMGMNLVGAGLTLRTHTWLPELFDRAIARPLQFGPYHWNLMANGEGYLGGGAFLRPRDYLKLGQAYLDGGVWHGRRIVDASWVEASTAPHMQVSPATTGLSPEEFGNFYAEAWDGYAWHLGVLQARGRSYRTYAATGNGGQVLIVVPEAELVVAFTGGNFGQGGVWGRWADQIIGQQILPTIRDQPASRDDVTSARAP